MTLFDLKLYLLTIPIFFAIDLVWLGLIANNLYQKNLAQLLSPLINGKPALGPISACLSRRPRKVLNGACSATPAKKTLEITG